jgi:hypothetical protein
MILMHLMCLARSNISLIHAPFAPRCNANWTGTARARARAHAHAHACNQLDMHRQAYAALEW